jgi:hypothetical protein
MVRSQSCNESRELLPSGTPSRIIARGYRTSHRLKVVDLNGFWCTGNHCAVRRKADRRQYLLHQWYAPNLS